MKRGKKGKRANQKIEKGRPGALKTGGRCLRNKDHGSDSVQIKYSDHLAAKGRGSIAPGLIKTARENSSHPPEFEIQAGQIWDKAKASPGCSRRRGFSSGFSLVETLLAMAIVFFLLAGTAQMLCYSFLLKQKADLHQISADLVSRKIEVLKSLEPGDEALSPGIHQETIQDSNSGRSFFLRWVVIEEENLKKIQLSLYPAPFGSRPPLKACWFRSETLGF